MPVIQPVGPDLARYPIDPEDSAYQDLLKHLQGNILQAHRGMHALHIFLQFTVTPDRARRWLHDYVTSGALHITSAYEQYNDQNRELTTSATRLFCNVFLSAKGYKALGYEEAVLKDKFGDVEKGGRFQFLDGMEKHADLLGDVVDSDWDNGYNGNKIDLMIFLAHDNVDTLNVQRGNITKDVDGIAAPLFVEYGHRLYQDNDRTKQLVDPFGYVTGISQPRFFSTAGRDFAPLDLVLERDPLALEKDCYGSYLVFRKLEQDVKTFQDKIKELADFLKCDKAMAEALVMGRFKDGTPLVLANNDKTPFPTNNFDYHGDPDGTRCPFHAHIRRLNPRGETAVNLRSLEDDEEELRHRIVRRGLSYGTLTVPTEPLPSKGDGVGTLFMCFQRSISRQFGFLQRTWANSMTKPGVQVPIGVDPIIGKGRQAQPAPPQPRWPETWGQQGFKRFPFESCVTCKGGEYLFAPSIPFFIHLLDEKPSAME